MLRLYMTQLDANGNGQVTINPENQAMEWDIGRIALKANFPINGCQAQITYNGFFVCGTAQGSLDTAVGPPNLIIRPSEVIQVQWILGVPHDQVTVGIYYYENPIGTTAGAVH